MKSDRARNLVDEKPYAGGDAQRPVLLVADSVNLSAKFIPVLITAEVLGGQRIQISRQPGNFTINLAKLM